MVAIGNTTHVILCAATSGSGISITYDSGDDYQFILAPKPRISIKFNSKNKHRAFHKSRLTPDVKYMQSYKVANGKFEAKDANNITEWLMDAYIAKSKIYLIVQFSTDGGSTWVNKSWYDDSNTKVYYLKGLLKKLDIEQMEGHIWKIMFDFEESW